jgi:hypothetical protein
MADAQNMHPISGADKSFNERLTDARRQKPINIRWNGMIGRIYIDQESWGAIEWSDQRQAWCIEDAEGRCLSHHSHVHGEDKDKDGASSLAEAMIRDGRMPSPEEARKARSERLKRNRERRAKQPSEIKRRAARAERDRLWHASYEAEAKDRWTDDDAPLFEVFSDFIDFDDPDLWKSNSFARLRQRLIIHLHAVIAGLEANCYLPPRIDRAARLKRAREVLELLKPETELQ